MAVEPKENADLLEKKSGNQRNGPSDPEDDIEPPDGGVRAFAVLFASFVTNGLIFGIINSYSVIFPTLESILKKKMQNASSSASLVGSLTMGTMFFLSPVSGVLSRFLGPQKTAVIGGSIAATGMFISSFFIDNAMALYFTYGIMYGTGASFAYIPSLAILGHYFKVHLSKVNGVVTIGSSVFTVFISEIMKYMIHKYGLPWLFRLLALFTLCLALCGLLFKPLLKTKSSNKKGIKAFFQTVVNVEMWKIRKYVIWALSIPVALFGYFVPYVHIQKFVKLNFPDANENLPLQCIAITSGIGRLTFGYLGDRPGIDRILLQQIAFYVIGILTMILPFMNMFGLVIAITLGMGLFDGAFISLMGPIAIQLCGSSNAAQAIGWTLGMTAPPLSLGPPIATCLYDIHKSYKLPFVVCGVTPILGATLMFTVRCHGCSSKRAAATSNGTPAQSTPARVDTTNGPTVSLLREEERYHQSTL